MLQVTSDIINSIDATDRLDLLVRVLDKEASLFIRHFFLAEAVLAEPWILPIAISEKIWKARDPTHPAGLARTVVENRLPAPMAQPQPDFTDDAAAMYLWGCLRAGCNDAVLVAIPLLRTVGVPCSEADACIDSLNFLSKVGNPPWK